MVGQKQHKLGGITLLEGLSETQLQELQKNCSWRRYGAQEIIIDRDSDSRDIFFVVDGKVRVVNYSLSGREVSFDDIMSGGYFGELAAIDGEPRSANVVALTETTVSALSTQRLLTLVAENPAIAIELLRRLAHVVRRATDRIMDLSTLGAHFRVYVELLRLARENSRDDNTARIQPIPIHSEIASRVSTTRETVARVLSDLARAEVVKRDRDALLVLDMVRLADMVEQIRGE